MRDDSQSHDPGVPFEPAPTWLRALQAAAIGVIAGLALYAIMSVVVVHAGNANPVQPAPKTCTKASPAREVVVPALEGPAVSSLRLVVTGRL